MLKYWILKKMNKKIVTLGVVAIGVVGAQAADAGKVWEVTASLRGFYDDNYTTSPDELAEEMRKHWDEGEIVEILGVIALFGYLNRWNDSMGTQLEEPAADSGNQYLAKKGWSRGKHQY